MDSEGVQGTRDPDSREAGEGFEIVEGEGKQGLQFGLPYGWLQSEGRERRIARKKGPVTSKGRGCRSNKRAISSIWQRIPRSGFSRYYSLGASGRSRRMIYYPEELIQSRRDQSTPTLEK